jgi:hypothetical protein
MNQLKFISPRLLLSTFDDDMDVVEGSDVESIFKNPTSGSPSEITFEASGEFTCDTNTTNEVRVVAHRFPLEADLIYKREVENLRYLAWLVFPFGFFLSSFVFPLSVFA